MLWMLSALLLVAWLAGMVGAVGAWVHVLLVMAIVVGDGVADPAATRSIRSDRPSGLEIRARAAADGEQVAARLRLDGDGAAVALDDLLGHRQADAALASAPSRCGTPWRPRRRDRRGAVGDGDLRLLGRLVGARGDRHVAPLADADTAFSATATSASVSASASTAHLIVAAGAVDELDRHAALLRVGAARARGPPASSALAATGERAASVGPA